MNTKHFFNCLFIMTLLCNFSCSSDSNGDNDENQTNDISISVDEYPRSGTFLSEIITNLDGNVTYNITSETSAQALIITQEQLAVGDWLAFDYETNSTLTAIIEASNGTETETINVIVTINNVDDIWAFLRDETRTAYENASDGEWVWIKESEYNDLANYLVNTTKNGASDNQIFSNASVENYSGNRTIANDNDITIPGGSYLFAFKYYSWINNVVSSKIKVSQDDSGGAYEDFGSLLPEHDDEFNHFVLKGATSVVSQSYLGMYAAGAVGVRDDSNSRYKWRNGDVTTLDNTALGTVFLHQGLSTTLKQWD